MHLKTSKHNTLFVFVLKVLKLLLLLLLFILSLFKCWQPPPRLPTCSGFEHSLFVVMGHWLRAEFRRTGSEEQLLADPDWIEWLVSLLFCCCSLYSFQRDYYVYLYISQINNRPSYKCETQQIDYCWLGLEVILKKKTSKASYNKEIVIQNYISLRKLKKKKYFTY